MFSMMLRRVSLILGPRPFKDVGVTRVIRNKYVLASESGAGGHTVKKPVVTVVSIQVTAEESFARAGVYGGQSAAHFHRIDNAIGVKRRGNREEGPDLAGRHGHIRALQVQNGLCFGPWGIR